MPYHVCQYCIAQRVAPRLNVAPGRDRTILSQVSVLLLIIAPPFEITNLISDKSADPYAYPLAFSSLRIT
ncbi:hypothetical protein NHQ30_004600 [Ciborinia camelliae]|nr:hypothetical protein NHQ30_004600 [Ciborinia camelliae]